MPTGNLPILWVATTVDYFDDHLVHARLGDSGVNDCDLRPIGNEGFFHVVW